MEITKPSWALIVIDMQNDFVLPDSPSKVDGAMDSVRNVRVALEWFRAKGYPVFHVVREYRADGSDVEMFRLEEFLKQPCAVPGTEGCEIVADLKPVEGEYRLVKNRFSAFMNTELDLMLNRLGVTHLAVCGTQYPNCIRTTVYDAVSYGYDVTVLTDATSAKTPEVAQANITDMENIGVSCMPMFLFQSTAS